MLPTEQHVRTARAAKAGWLVARAFPTAMPRGLQVVADWTVLFCTLDDHIERMGSASEVATYLQHLLDVFRADIAGSLEDPFAAGMSDLQRRLLGLAARRCFTHFGDRLEDLFAGFVAEALNRERAQIPDLASYLPLREITIGLHVMFALAELLDEFSLPERLGEHPALRKLATRASNIVGWANDLFTYEKEIIGGEIHNLVLVLMNEHRLTVAEAVAEAVALHDSEVRNFLQEVEQLPSIGVAHAGVQRYVEMLRCWIRGHRDWAHETGRYRPFDVPAGEQTSPPAGRLSRHMNLTRPGSPGRDMGGWPCPEPGRIALGGDTPKAGMTPSPRADMQ
jgi:5-epi-alpha-selinene synthase